MPGNHWDSLPESERARIHAANGGQGLPGDLRQGYEQAFGGDLSNVRVHYNSHRPQELGARAFTNGNDIFLGPAPDQVNRHLIGHELTHVVQQRGGATATSAGVNPNGDPAGEAARAGVRAGVTP